jgi:hypothetical protein
MWTSTAIRTRPIRRTVTLLAVAALSGGVAGIGGSTLAGASSAQIAKSVVQSQAARILAKETGQMVPKVICPHGLNAKVGAVVHCALVPAGSTVRYPAVITVKSIHASTATFDVQVGQAPGAANLTKFCADNARLGKAVGGATTPAAFLKALRGQQATLVKFQSTAPPQIVDDVGRLIQAARQAVKTDKVNPFETKSVQAAGAAVSKFCGQAGNSG